MRKRHKKGRRGQRRAGQDPDAKKAPETTRPGAEPRESSPSKTPSAAEGPETTPEQPVATPLPSARPTPPPARPRPVPVRPQPVRMHDGGGAETRKRSDRSVPTPVRPREPRAAPPPEPEPREVLRGEEAWTATVVGSARAPLGVPLLEVQFSHAGGRQVRGLIPGEQLSEIEADDLLGLLDALLRSAPEA